MTLTDEGMRLTVNIDVARSKILRQPLTATGCGHVAGLSQRDLKLNPAPRNVRLHDHSESSPHAHTTVALGENLTSHSRFGGVGLQGPGRRLLSQPVEVPIGNDEETQEDQRIEDVEGVQRRPSGVPNREMRDAGGHERDCKAEVGELLHLERDARNQQRQHAQSLCDGEFNSEVVRQLQMDEGALRVERLVEERKRDDAVSPVSYTHLTLPTTERV